MTETAVNDLLNAVGDNARFYAPDSLLATDEFHRGQMVAEAEYRIFVQALGTEVTNRLHRVLRPLLKEGIELEGGVKIGNLSLIRDQQGEVTNSIDLFSDEKPIARVLFNEVDQPLGNNCPNWLVINRLPRREKTSIFLNYLMASSYIPEGITKQDISCIIQQKDFGLSDI